MKIITKKKIIKYLTIFLIILSLILIFNLILTNFSKPQLKISDLSYLITSESALNNNTNTIKLFLSKNPKKFFLFKIFLFSFLIILTSIITYLIKKINFDNSEYNKKINNIFIHKNGETDELILINIK
jgi:hypothetical protein